MTLTEEQQRKRREYRKRWELKNPDKAKACRKKWEENNRDKVNARARRYRQKNIDKCSETNQKWREANPEKIKEYSRAYYEANAGKLKRKRREYYRANIESEKEKSKQYHQSNPERKRLSEQKRRAQKRGSGGSFTVQDWEVVKKRFRNTCPACGRSEPEIKLTIDHIVPLSKGGCHDKDNIQPLCVCCNSSKRIRVVRWNTEGQLLMIEQAIQSRKGGDT